MTRQEAVSTLAMIADNWTFLKALKEAESNSFEIFYTALQSYPVEEVQQGIRNAIRELKSTPVVADIITYVEDVRRGKLRATDDVNVRQAFNDAVRCPACNDHGYVNIVYPSGDQAIRVCDCAGGHLRFGDDAYKLVNRDLPEWKRKMYFGDKDPNDFKVIRGSRIFVETEKGKREMFVAYRPTNRPKEECYGIYVPK